jgi:ERF superfamily
MPTRSKSAAATADEAQQPAEAPPVMEGEPVNEKAEQRRANTQDMINQLREVIVQRMRGEINPKLAKLQEQLDGLADTLTAVQESQGDGAGIMLEEDALNDKLTDIADTRIGVLLGIKPGETPDALIGRIDGLATALAQHQADVDQRARQGREALESTLRAWQEDLEGKLSAELTTARLGEASATGVLRDVVAEQRRAVPGVYAKVHKLMLRVEEIGKGRQYKAESRGDSGNVEYSFRGIDDAMDAVGAGLRAVGLIMRSKVVEATHEVHSVEKRPGWVQHWATTRLTMRYTFVDPADGSEHAVEGYGVGKDLGDKDGSKASSAAMKYALFQGLCIPVKGMNIDPETEHPTDPGPAPEQPQERRPTPAAQQPDVAPPPPSEDNPDGEPPETRAAKALRAARAAQDEQALTGVLIQATREGILAVEVEGYKLQQHLVALRRTVRPSGGGQQDG